MPIADMGGAEFQQQLDRLTQRLESGANTGCIECTRCVACTRCTFCRESERLVGCHYCVRARACTECSHCRESERLIGCQHCLRAEDCVNCNYVTMSYSLSNCSYCFGCVGLSGKDFHILNQGYARQDYFEITARLSRELRLPR